MADYEYSGYRPLNKDDHEIRLLQIQRPSADSKIHGSLKTYSLDSLPSNADLEYVAISYYWGAPGRSKPIVLDGQTVQIRQNLRACLKALAKRFQEILIWVDAISINQFDEDEKSSQVQMMGQIYATASRVFAWLGAGSADTDQLFSMALDQHQPALQGRSFQPSLDQQRVGFQQLFLNLYWRRVWTFQERTLAREVWLLCGDQMDSWTNIKIKFKAFQDREMDHMLLSTTEDGDPLKWNTLLPREHVQRGQSLAMLIRECGRLCCSDIRDKAYGLRNLARDGHRLVVDYGQPALQVVLNVLCLDHGHPLGSYHGLVRSLPLSRADILQYLEPGEPGGLSLCARESMEGNAVCIKTAASKIDRFSGSQIRQPTTSVRFLKITLLEYGSTPLQAYCGELMGLLQFKKLVWSEGRHRDLEYISMPEEHIRDIFKALWKNGHIRACKHHAPWPSAGVPHTRLRYSRLAILASSLLAILSESKKDKDKWVKDLFPALLKASQDIAVTTSDIPCQNSCLETDDPSETEF